MCQEICQEKIRCGLEKVFESQESLVARCHFEQGIVRGMFWGSANVMLGNLPVKSFSLPDNILALPRMMQAPPGRMSRIYPGTILLQGKDHTRSIKQQVARHIDHAMLGFLATCVATESPGTPLRQRRGAGVELLL